MSNNFIKFGTNNDTALAIQELITQNINNINTAFLAKITAINGNKLSVKPIARKSQTAQNAIINNVLIAQPKSGIWEISFKLSVGDIGLCIVCDSDISLYKQSGSNDFLVNSNRKFNLNDCVFLPLSLYSQKNADFKISDNQGNVIGFSNGTLTINANSDLTIQGDKLAFKSSKTTLKSELEALIEILLASNLDGGTKAKLTLYKANNINDLFKE